MKMQHYQSFAKTFFVLLLFSVSQFAIAQCGTVITSFPYNEDFEISNGGWFSGGISSDWAWGTPSKPVIKNAFSGQKCWITGGLTASSYADNERSWLQSPCFDFTSLQHPYISFEVFWETEQKYDGAAFQYSLDGGLSWLNTGRINEATNCLLSKWYNYSPVVFLSSFGATDGWSGNIQNSGGNCLNGGGSGTWYTDQRTLPLLAGEPKVIFRFIFAAGNICNNYDGFAFDHISIGEAPANNADFNFTCINNNTIDFANVSALCPDSFVWDFGDPASGISNTASVANPSHTFSASGIYTVMLTVNGPDNAASSITKTITVLGLSTSVVSSVQCNGDKNGIAAVAVSGGSGNYLYQWNTNPEQINDTAINLSAGTYTVRVDDANTCSVSANITITEPDLLQVTVQTQNAICTANNGAAIATVTGGTMPYKYLWSPIVANSQSISNLSPGNYSLSITDSNVCSVSQNNIAIASINSLKIFLGNDTTLCPGNQFILQPGGYKNYLWQDNSTASSYTVLREGDYWVRVSDSLGCIAADTISVKEDCGEIYFPSGFTPNGDGLNDYFGPLGNLAAVSNYHLSIFNRWGQPVFQSADPYFKWNGKFSTVTSTGSTFVWMAGFSYNNQKNIFRKGTVTVIK